jgi:hypothetical protein
MIPPDFAIIIRMSNLKPFEIIASQFDISPESAKYFLGRVQKSFKKDKPPQALILEFMAGQGYEFLPKPYHVAKMLQEGGLWVFPMNAEPRGPQSDDEEEDLDFEEFEFLDDAEEDL